jgi:hypothetical protein|eukprot:COSAG01_NODE_2188_length_8194_cov_481.771093_10_plen_46_part_00
MIMMSVFVVMRGSGNIIYLGALLLLFGNALHFEHCGGNITDCTNA